MTKKYEVCPLVLDGAVTSYVVVDIAISQLASVHIYPEAEAAKMCAELNDNYALQQFWPDYGDPEVNELVNDPGFEPDVEKHLRNSLTWRRHQAAELVARRRANLEV